MREIKLLKYLMFSIKLSKENIGRCTFWHFKEDVALMLKEDKHIPIEIQIKFYFIFLRFTKEIEGIKLILKHTNYINYERIRRLFLLLPSKMLDLCSDSLSKPLQWSSSFRRHLART